MSIHLNESLKAELGQKIVSWLDDPEIVEVMLNPDGSLWVDSTDGMSEKGRLKEERAASIVATLAGMAGTEIHETSPILETILPFDGSRVEAMVPPIVDRPAFAIRKKAIKIYPLEAYIKSGRITAGEADYFRKAISERKNIMLVGGPGSGKTTFANALLAEMAKLCPRERVLIFQDVKELQVNTPNRVEATTNEAAGVDLLRLLRVSLRFRPDRIVIGEARGGEVLDLLKLWGTGSPGGIGTLHANSATEAFTRIEQMILEVSSREQEYLIGSTIDVIAFLERKGSLRGAVSEIVEIDSWSPKEGYITKLIKERIRA